MDFILGKLFGNNLFKDILCISGVWMLISALSCFSLNILTEFYSIVISFILFLSCSICSVIAMSVAVNLYPTKHRGMATSFMQLIGRIGTFTYGNVVGLLLANSCASIFYLNGALVASKFHLRWLSSIFFFYRHK